MKSTTNPTYLILNTGTIITTINITTNNNLSCNNLRWFSATRCSGGVSKLKWCNDDTLILMTCSGGGKCPCG